MGRDYLSKEIVKKIKHAYLHDRRLTIAQIAKKNGVSESAVYSWVAKLKLKKRRNGSKLNKSEKHICTVCKYELNYRPISARYCKYCYRLIRLGIDVYSLANRHLYPLKKPEKCSVCYRVFDYTTSSGERPGRLSPTTLCSKCYQKEKRRERKHKTMLKKYPSLEQREKINKKRRLYYQKNKKKIIEQQKRYRRLKKQQKYQDEKI